MTINKRQSITRTIWVSCLSHFLLYSCTQEKFVMNVAPGHAHPSAIKILHLDYFLAPTKLVPRHCASAPLTTFYKRDNFTAIYQNSTATHVMLNKICTRTAKTRAIPSLHRDSFAAKVPRLCPVLSSGNTTSPYCRAVGGN
jgi:hypothetical protein